MDFDLQPDTPEISAFRKEVREWLEENMRAANICAGRRAG